MHYQIIKPTRPREARHLLELIDRAVELGARVDLPEVKRARTALARVEDIDADAARLRATDMGTAEAAKRYHEGGIDVEEVARIAAAIDAGAGTTAGRIVDAARSRANAAAVAELVKPGDRYLDALRPVLGAVLEPLADLADRVPDGMGDGNASHHSFAYDTKAQKAWAELVDVHRQAHELHSLVDSMRNAGMVPATAGTHSEDYRWGRLDLLRGSVAAPVILLLDGYRNGAEPTLRTDAELTMALDPLPAA